MTLATFAKSALDKIQDNSPIILTSVAVAGAATTAYLANRAGFLASSRIWEAEQEKGEHLTGKEKVQLCWPLYIPTGLALGSTIACTIGAHAVNTRRNAALASAVTLGEAALREYRDKVEEVVTKPKREEIARGLAQDKLDQTTDSAVYVVGDGDILAFDTLTSRLFKTTEVAIRTAENEMNRRILNQDYIFLNEWFDAVGLPRTGMGDDYGWCHECPLEVNFTPLIKEGKPVIGLDYRFPPISSFKF